jgi:hypothetical protein
MQHPGIIAFLCVLTLLWLWQRKPINRMTRLELRALVVCHAFVAAAFKLLSRILRG